MQYVESCGGLRGITPHKHKREMERKTHSPTISNKKNKKKKENKKKEERKVEYEYPSWNQSLVI